MLAQQPSQPTMTDDELIKLIGGVEKPERTPRGAKPQQQTSNKKKKGKK